MKGKNGGRNTKACLENSMKDDLAGTWVSCELLYEIRLRSYLGSTWERPRMTNNSPSLLRSFVLAVFPTQNAFPPDLQMLRSCSLCRSSIKVISSKKSTLTNLWKQFPFYPATHSLPLLHFISFIAPNYLIYLLVYCLPSQKPQKQESFPYCSLPNPNMAHIRCSVNICSMNDCMRYSLDNE